MEQVEDEVDRVVRQWESAWPELDASPCQVWSRVERLASLADAELEVVLAQHGLSRAGYDVLAALRRSGPPFRVPQKALIAEARRTPGTVSVLLDRLEAAELVERAPDPDDGRGVLVALTARGRELLDSAVPAYQANARALLAALTDDETRTLAALLRKLLAALGSAESGRAPGALGVAVSPAHVALRMRRAVGLPDRIGLLVRAVEPGSPAARAGIQEGDLITAAGGRPVRTVADLRRVLAERTRSVELDLVRGTDERTARVMRGAS